MPLLKDHATVVKLLEALELGRPREGETHETSGFLQVEAVIARRGETQEVGF